MRPALKSKSPNSGSLRSKTSTDAITPVSRGSRNWVRRCCPKKPQPPVIKIRSAARNVEARYPPMERVIPLTMHVAILRRYQLLFRLRAS